MKKKSFLSTFIFTPFSVSFFVPLLFLLPFLSGCTGMGSKFDCNVSSGGRCASMKKINRMVDYGAFNDNHLYKRGGGYKTDRTSAKNNLVQKWYGEGYRKNKKNKKNGYLLDAFEGFPVRSNESIQQIWIGPYEDTNGNYHEPSYVYTVIKKGSWIGEPASVIQD